MRGRISVPPRLCARPWKLAPIRPKVTPYAVSFEKFHKFIRKLYEFVIAIVQSARVAGRVALEQRIVPIFLVLVESKRQRSVSGGRSRFAPLLLSPRGHWR